MMTTRTVEARTVEALGAILTIAVVAGCSGGAPEQVRAASLSATVPAPATTRPPASVVTTTTSPPTATTTTTTSTTTTTTTTLPPIPRQPLTGTPLDGNNMLVERPALVVKIDNAPPARRNQSGLAVADIVFEEIVEANITRFAAVFHSQDSDVVGPIRSGRTQDIDLFTSFDRPLFAWSGGNPGVTEMIGDAPFVDLNAVRGGKGYYRGNGKAPHNLYNSTERLWAQTPTDHPGVAPRQFRYVRPAEPFDGVAVAGVELRLRSIDVSWRWDADRDQFVRSQEGVEHVDALHGSIGATNVVVMVVEYRPSVVDARSPEAQTVGQGPVFLFARGRMVEGRWWRDSAEDPIKFIALDGVTPLAIVPGNTWVELAEADITDSLLTATADMTVIPAE